MTIEDTSKRDPLLHLVGMIGEGQGVYITGMEADGQRQVVNSDALPTKAPWDELEALGFVKGERQDDLFTSCTLPDSWKRQGSDHSMWSHIVDERGVKRVAIFYKAAFYDRSAHASLVRPGYDLASEAIYGDGPAILPEQWPVLTGAERSDFRSELARYGESAVEYPSIYGDRMPRVNALAELASAD
jgi:hypothetical protein